MESLALHLGVEQRVLRSLAKGPARRLYRSFPIKKGDSSQRSIDWPLPELMTIQKCIKVRLLDKLPLSEVAHGSVKRRSQHTNAARHVRATHVLTMDIQNFFPSVNHRRVYRVWKEAFGFGPEPARALTRLTTLMGCLPQGAPTSGGLANIALIDFDEAISRDAQLKEATLTRYVDDITISSNEKVDPFFGIVVDELRKLGLKPKRRKTALVNSAQRQETTGLVVNRRLSLSRQKTDRIRSAIHALRDEQDPVNRAAASASITGRINHVTMTNPGRADRLQRNLEAAFAVEPST